MILRESGVAGAGLLVEVGLDVEESGWFCQFGGVPDLFLSWGGGGSLGDCTVGRECRLEVAPGVPRRAPGVVATPDLPGVAYGQASNGWRGTRPAAQNRAAPAVHSANEAGIPEL